MYKRQVQGEYTPRQQAERAAALVCREAGFDEAMSHSFISPKFYEMCIRDSHTVVWKK